MVSHKEFETAGKSPGLQIWRIEKMDLSPVPKEMYGTFYVGDAYLLLFTILRPKPPHQYTIHMWLGNECTQDESAAVSILATQLDDHFGGGPVQYREVQGAESLAFIGYFWSSLKYKKGGFASGFKNVVPNSAEVKRLLHVKGRRTIRASEVDMSWTSFNKGDIFILDLGKDIYQWCGSESNMFERLKASQVAIEIRDSERGGRAKIEMLDEGEEPEIFMEVLGPKTAIAPASDDDHHADLSNRKQASLYMVSNASGSMELSEVASSSPFQQTMLSQDECYILDDSNDKIVFVWKGSKANEEERKSAFTDAQNFLKEKGYSSKTQIQVLPAGAETALFKQFFCNWLDKYETTGPTDPYTIGTIAKVEQVPFDASTLHDNTVMAAQHGMVDDGSGKMQIWRVEGGDRVAVDPASHGHFYGGDCYLILYTYKAGGREQHLIYTWQGLKCTQDELAASAFLTVKLDDSMGGSPVQVRVTQGQETPHLMSLFREKPMVIHKGGTSRKGGQTKEAPTRLFHIRESSTKATRAVEVEASASSLNTNDVFVLKSSGGGAFVWRGAGAHENEMGTANYVVQFLGGSATSVTEGSEPAEFWTLLGGKKEYQTSTALRNVVSRPRLFGCSNKTGRLVVEEVPGDISQSDLATDDVMLLDTGDQIFIWVGIDTNEVEKTGAPKLAKDYVDTDPSGRKGTPLTTIKQGAEPPTFTGWFQAWDPKMWETDPLDRIRARF